MSLFRIIPRSRHGRPVDRAEVLSVAGFYAPLFGAHDREGLGVGIDRGRGLRGGQVPVLRRWPICGVLARTGTVSRRRRSLRRW